MGRFVHGADGDDAIAPDPDVAHEGWAAGPVDNGSAANDSVKHGSTPSQ